MVHLNVKDWILFISAVLLGILGCLFRLYILVPVALIILFTALGTSGKFRHHELAFLFPLSFAACLPVNISLAGQLSYLFMPLYSFAFENLCFFLFFLLVLITIEELFLCFIGTVLWEKQELFFCPDGEPEEELYVGTYLQEIRKEDIPKQPSQNEPVSE